MSATHLPLPETFELNGTHYQTDSETLAVLRSIVPAAKSRGDGSAVQAVIELGLVRGRVRLIPPGPEVRTLEGVEYFRDTRAHWPDATLLATNLERAGWRDVRVASLPDEHRFCEPEPGGGACLVTAWRPATYQIEIANRIERGRAVGTDYVVTQRPIGRTGIVARFAERVDAAKWIVAQPPAWRCLRWWPPPEPELRPVWYGAESA